jgi:type IV secretory pathway protease TraF
VEGLGRFLTRVVVTLVALVTVLLVFVVEPVLAEGAKEPTVLLLDRGRRLRVGDRAFCTHKGQRLLARVAAAPNQKLALRGNLLFIDGEPVERRPCRKGEGGAFEGARERCFVERRGDRAWPVMAPPDGRRVELETTVPAGTVYLLNDDRAQLATDSRGLGPVAREACRSVAAEVAFASLRLRP